MSTYVIRAKCFGYNDEVFYVAGNRIANVFSDKAQAEATYRQLEINSARDFGLYEVESLFDADEATLQALDAFVFERCGEHIYEDGEISDAPLPDELSDDDTFEFIQRADMQAFQLVHFETEPKFHALWINKTQDYLKIHDECFSTLAYAETAEGLNDDVEIIFYEYESPLVLTGALEQLSETPVLLQAAIDTHKKNAKYNASKQELTIKHDTDTLLSINALLKEPLFEIRQLSIEEIQEIEAGLASEYGYDEEYDEE